MKAILKNIWAVLNGKEKKQFSILILLDFFISVLDILSLALLLWIVQYYVQPGNRIGNAFLPGWLNDSNDISVIAIFFVLFGLKNLIAFIIARAHYRFIGRIAVRISRHNLASYQQGGYHEFVNTDSSAHIRKIAFQPFEFCQYILAGTQQIITQLFLIVIAITAILLFNAKLFLLLLLVLMPAVIVVFYGIKNKLAAAKKSIRTNNERSFQYLLDALKAYVEGNIFNRNRFFLERFVRFRQKFSASLFESLSLQSLPGRVIEIFAVLGLFILIAIAKWTNNNDSNTLLTIGAFMAAAYRIIPGIVKLINISGQIKTYEFALNDLVQTSKQLSDPHQNGKPTCIHSLELKNIRFQYNGKPVLDSFSMTLNKGDLAGLSGSSGKGKTTIFNIMLGLLPTAHGRIYFNNTATINGDIRNYWPSISYVKQQSFLIHDTILRNITLEEESYHKENLAYALRVSGLDELVDSFPEKLGKIISENGKNISGGQQQRIAIARAVYKNPDMMLLDEPFNELDEGAELKMLAHFKEMTANGKIILFVTHNKKTLGHCNKIISLDEPA